MAEPGRPFPGLDDYLYWQERLASREASGLSIDEFCAAVLFTVLAGAKRHRIEPWAYLREILLRLHAEDPRLDEMLPDRWAAGHSEMVLTYRLEESRQKASGQRDRRRRRRTQHRPK